MTDFIQYSDVIFDAFRLHAKQDEIVDRKKAMVRQVLEHYNLSANKILFVGFNPAMLANLAAEVYVAEVSDRVINWLHEHGVPAKPLSDPKQQVDLVIACDEYLTFAKNEQEQRDKIFKVCNLSNGLVITTIKDYKNQDFKEREHSQPAIIKNNGMLTSFIEIHNWSLQDRNSLETSVYSLTDASAESLGIYARRALFFKQLAKFSIDAGAQHFYVHKNLMYKSLIKKNYEHVVSIEMQQ